ncbi:MAG: DNA methyltransferase [Methylococcales bacterium]
MGIHSYLTYLRDRLLLALELLADSGSIFVQISDENVHHVHHVREIMDEMFGVGNFVALIAFQKTGSQAGSLLGAIYGLLVFASFFFDCIGQKTQLLPYIRPVIGS